MLHALIMAGGAGTRFWPLSRIAKPKQLLQLAGKRTMIQSTLDRLEGLLPPERVNIITAAHLVDGIGEQLPQLPKSSVLGEPCKRDTAPCVGLGAMLAMKHDPDATLVVMPADHVIEPAEEFRRAISAAAALVEESPERIVTFGIRPTFPAETFGYIQRGLPLAGGASPGVASFAVERFREKPARSVAEEYLEAGNFYWNSGIFVWKAKTILAAIERLDPTMYSCLVPIAEAAGTPDFTRVFEQKFSEIKGRSIDFTVLEHYKPVVVVEAPFQWNDVGSWQSLASMHGTDESGNTLLGKQVAIRSTGSVVYTTDEHLVTLLGMDDCIVVHTPDATLVANKHEEEAVREIVKRLGELGWKEHL